MYNKGISITVVISDNFVNKPLSTLLLYKLGNSILKASEHHFNTNHHQSVKYMCLRATHMFISPIENPLDVFTRS